MTLTSSVVAYFTAPSTIDIVLRQLIVLNWGASVPLFNALKNPGGNPGTIRVLTDTIPVNSTKVWDVRTILLAGESLYLTANPAGGAVCYVMGYEFDAG